MCGVVAYYSDKPEAQDKKILKDLILQSKIRGLHAFGMAYTHKKNTIIEKTNNIKNINIPDTNMLIYHNRYTTSGDWQKEKNNQPLQLHNNFLVFNGVIDMSTKKEMQKKHNFKMNSDNDGELFLHYLMHKDPVKILKDLKCSFAGVYIRKNNIYCIRNEHRPLYVVTIGKSVFIASTKDIFKRSGIDNAQAIVTYKNIELKQFIYENTGIQKISYPNDAKWGYRSSIQLPTLHSS